MSRLLVRAHKSPFKVVSPSEALVTNPFGSNVGNLVFGQAAIRLLSTRGATVETSGLIGKAPQLVNAEYDHVVIPLANAFRVAYADSLDRLSALIEQLTVPVTVLGVGAQANIDGQHSKRGKALGPRVQRFVRAVLERSPSIGVRGEFTRDYLADLGFGDDQIDLIGCPSMFMDGPSLTKTRTVEQLTTSSKVALNISPYVAAMGPISLDLPERYPNVCYFPQDLRTLHLMERGTYPAEGARAAVESGAPVYLEHPLIASDRVRFCLEPTTWFAALSEFDFSLGTRIHGNIAAILAGTPAMVLAHDSRTLELARYHKIPHRMLRSLERVDPIELYAQGDWEPMHVEHGLLWDRFAAFLDCHDLSHVFGPGENPQAFDDQLAATAFLPPVGTLMGMSPAELYAMKGELDQRREHSLRPGIATLPSRVRSWASALRRPTAKSGAAT